MKKINFKKTTRRQGAAFTNLVNTIAINFLSPFFTNRQSLLNSLSAWVSAITFNNLNNTFLHQEEDVVAITKAASLFSNN